MRMKIYLRLSAAGFPLTMGCLFFEFSCAKLDTFFSLDVVHYSFFLCCTFLLKLYIRFVVRENAPRQILQSFLRCCSSCSAVQEATAVDAGDEKGSHDSVTVFLNYAHP